MYDRLEGRRDGPFPIADPDGRLEGWFNALLVDPPLGLALEHLGRAIRFDTALPGRLREIVVLEVAAALQSQFEWFAHELAGRAEGLRSEELDAIRLGREVETFDAVERLTRQLVRRLLVDRDLSDDEFDEAVEELGLVEVFEITVTVGWFQLVALALGVFRLPAPDGVEEVTFGGSS